MGGIRKTKLCSRNIDQTKSLNDDFDVTINSVTNSPDQIIGSGTGVQNLSNSITIT